MKINCCSYLWTNILTPVKINRKTKIYWNEIWQTTKIITWYCFDNARSNLILFSYPLTCTFWGKQNFGCPEVIKTLRTIDFKNKKRLLPLIWQLCNTLDWLENYFHGKQVSLKIWKGKLRFKNNMLVTDPSMILPNLRVQAHIRFNKQLIYIICKTSFENIVSWCINHCGSNSANTHCGFSDYFNWQEENSVAYIFKILSLIVFNEYNKCSTQSASFHPTLIAG